MVTTESREDLVELVPYERAALNRRRAESKYAEIWALLDQVYDPELPALSLWELGVLQDVLVEEGSQDVKVTVVLTPTYSGCPAIGQMTEDVKLTLDAAGYVDATVTQQLAPPWTTDWLSTKTREKLRQYGISPPADTSCPQCGSESTELISEFGSTACKSLFKCLDCLEPFEHLKAH